jgi:hypothetical protein
MMRRGVVLALTAAAAGIAAPQARAVEFKPAWGYASIDDNPFSEPSGTALPAGQAFPRGRIKDAGTPDGYAVKLTVSAFTAAGATLSSYSVTENKAVYTAIDRRFTLDPEQIAYLRYDFCRADGTCLPAYRIRRPAPAPAPAPGPTRDPGQRHRRRLRGRRHAGQGRRGSLLRVPRDAHRRARAAHARQRRACGRGGRGALQRPRLPVQAPHGGPAGERRRQPDQALPPLAARRNGDRGPHHGAELDRQGAAVRDPAQARPAGAPAVLAAGYGQTHQVLSYALTRCAASWSSRWPPRSR